MEKKKKKMGAQFGVVLSLCLDCVLCPFLLVFPLLFSSAVSRCLIGWLGGGRVVSDVSFFCVHWWSIRQQPQAKATKQKNERTKSKKNKAKAKEKKQKKSRANEKKKQTNETNDGPRCRIVVISGDTFSNNGRVFIFLGEKKTIDGHHPRLSLSDTHTHARESFSEMMSRSSLDVGDFLLFSLFFFIPFLFFAVVRVFLELIFRQQQQTKKKTPNPLPPIFFSKCRDSFVLFFFCFVWGGVGG